MNSLNMVYNDEYTSLDNSARYISPLIIKYLTRNHQITGKLIDIGCGKGGVLKEINKTFGTRFQYFGMDLFYNPEEKINGDIKFIKKDLNNNFSDIEMKFDLIISTEVIEHVYDTDHFISQVKEMLKPNGTLIITTPNLASYFNRTLLLFGYQPLYTEVSWKKSLLGTEIVRKVLQNNKQYNNSLNESIFGHLRVFTFRALEKFLIFHGFTVEYRAGCTALSGRLLRNISNLFKVFPHLMPNIFIVAKKIKI